MNQNATLSLKQKEARVGLVVAHVVVHLGHVERVQRLGVADVGAHRRVLVLPEGLLVLDLEHIAQRSHPQPQSIPQRVKPLSQGTRPASDPQTPVCIYTRWT